MAKVKVYYNSACPVCDAGIKDQRERMESCKAQAEWIDIDQHPEALEELGVRQETVRERLYVVDEDGKTQIGADAFAVLWAKTPQQKSLSWLIRLPLIKQLARLFYNGFAALLYAWNRKKRRWIVKDED